MMALGISLLSALCACGNVEYHLLRGADHGYPGKAFELALSYIRYFLNNNKNRKKEEVAQ